MSKDLEVISHLVGSAEELVKKLEKSVNSNQIEETNKIKSMIFEINRKIHEELL
jgi:hypothetical protein